MKTKSVLTTAGIIILIASLAFTIAGILGASLTPYLATTLANNYGLAYVGYYLTVAAGFTLLALVASKGMMKEEAE